MKIKKMEHVFFQVLTLYINFLYKAYEFYMKVHPGRISIVANNFFVKNKIWNNIRDCITTNGNLLIKI